MVHRTRDLFVFPTEKKTVPETVTRLLVFVAPGEVAILAVKFLLENL